MIMKKNELNLIKGQSIKELADKAKGLRKEIAGLLIDLNMKKLKDTKSVFKKRKDLAQVLTILRQKQTLEQLESENSKSQINEKKTRTGQSSSTTESAKGGRTGLSK